MERSDVTEFWDYNEHTMDGKGRLVLPSSFRSAFDKGGVLTFQGNHLALLTPTGWDKALRKMIDSGDYSTRELSFIKSFVTLFTPDAQSRVTVPARLRDRVGLEREVAMIGMGSHIAIYPRAEWLAIEEEIGGGDDGRSALDERLADAL